VVEELLSAPEETQEMKENTRRAISGLLAWRVLDESRSKTGQANLTTLRK
jgi:hypothetical protein